MIKIETLRNIQLANGNERMQDPLNSWEKSDSFESEIGDNDCSHGVTHSSSGSDHRKFMRMINVMMDDTVPLYTGD